MSFRSLRAPGRSSLREYVQQTVERATASWPRARSKRGRVFRYQPANHRPSDWGRWRHPRAVRYQARALGEIPGIGRECCGGHRGSRCGRSAARRDDNHRHDQARSGSASHELPSDRLRIMLLRAQRRGRPQVLGPVHGARVPRSGISWTRPSLGTRYPGCERRRAERQRPGAAAIGGQSMPETSRLDVRSAREERPL